MGDNEQDGYLDRPLGLDCPPSEYAPLRPVIGGIEQSSAGNTILRAGQELASGGWMQTLHLVLSPAEREELIKRLVAHREQAPAS